MINLNVQHCIYLFNFFIQYLLHQLAEALKLGLVLLHLFLFLLILGQLQPLLGDRDQGLALKFLQLLHTVLINGLHHVENLKATLTNTLDKGRVSHLVLALTWGGKGGGGRFRTAT